MPETLRRDGGTARSRAAHCAKALVPGPRELFQGHRNPEGKARAPSYLSADWQVIMPYWSANISGVIYPFTHLVGKGSAEERGTWRRAKGGQVELVCQTTHTGCPAS